MTDEIKSSLSNTSSSQFAPSDSYTDGRRPGDWKTRYPLEARKIIYIEATYVIIFFLLYVFALFYMLYVAGMSASLDGAKSSPPSLDPQSNRCFFGYLCAWIAGGVGGSLFGIKWMYHSVAKNVWNEDRRLWRILTPHVSGAVSLFMVLLISSNLLQVFDMNLVNSHSKVLALGFLVGYFSDKALAKMAETADVLFGASKGNQNNGSRAEGPEGNGRDKGNQGGSLTVK